MKRIHQLDFFRGLLILVITIDHFFSPHNVIRKITDGFIGWVSAAEGFVFISGLTAGLVYTYKANKNGSKQVWKGIKQRVFAIYKYHILLFLIVLLLLTYSPLMRDFWSPTYLAAAKEPITTLIVYGALLHQPKYLDILPMYALFLLFVPLAISLFEKKQHTLILSLSGFLYLLGCLNIFSIGFKDHYLISLGYFNFACWQFLFFLGLSLGNLMFHNKIELRKLKKFFYLAVAVVVVCFICKRFYTGQLTEYVNLLTAKATLMPIRLLNTLSVTLILAFAAAKYEKIFSYQPVCYLGKHSLELFSLHIIAILLLKPLRDYFNSLYTIKLGESTFFYPVNTLVLVLGVIPAFFCLLYLKNKMTPKKSAKMQVFSDTAAPGVTDQYCLNDLSTLSVEKHLDDSDVYKV